jgi:CPA2 family monovalent cation:H+ antiporter-2
MHGFELIFTLTACLAAALVLGYATHRAGLSPIVGYLLAGIAVGRYTPGFVADQHLADQMAEIGVILLMFGVGLHFHLDQLLSVRKIAIPGAIGQSLVATALGAAVAHAFGWGWSAGIVYGLAISVASTVVLTRVLADNDELHTPTGHVAVGWLVVEDLLTVFVLVLLPAVFGGRPAGAGALFMEVAVATFKIGLLVAVIFVFGRRVVPWVLERAAATRSRELFTLTILVVALGIAVGSMKLFGVSMALGAFLAGMIVGRSEYSLRAAAEALPMRDAFAVLFFVSVGMLFDPRILLEAPGIGLATLAIVMLGKPLAAVAIVLWRGYPLRVALAVSVALAQIGEFSFILASLGKDLHILNDVAMHALIAASIVSISLNPILFRLLGPFESFVARHPKLSRRLNARAAAKSGPGVDLPAEVDDQLGPQHRAVVIGYGPVGRTLTRLLRENDILPTVVEMNLETVRTLRGKGRLAVYGDASNQETLKAAGVARSGTIILSASSIPGSEDIIRLSRELNADIRVLVRCAYLRERPALRKAGADLVFSEEGEVALAMTEAILQDLGATPDQIDRQRELLREDVIGSPAIEPARDAEQSLDGRQSL